MPHTPDNKEESRMNMHISFLVMVALLLGVCGAARCQDLPESVLALQGCFSQATTVRPLPEVRYTGEIAPAPWTLSAWYPREISTISPDGRQLFFVRELKGADGVLRLQSYFLDLTTGEASLAKMPDQQQLQDGEMLFPYIGMGAWDPLEPAYLYAEIPEYITDDYDIFSTIWRLNVETLVWTPVLPPIDIRLYNITPDGQYLLFYHVDEAMTSYPALYCLETHTWTQLPAEDVPYVSMPAYAPNGAWLAGFASPPGSPQGLPAVLAVRDLPTDRQALVFHANQALFSVPQGTHPSFSYLSPTWLPDSAGLFVNVAPVFEHTNSLDSTYTIWRVGVNGEAVAIASDIEVIANSQNGRYWLLQHEQRLYVMAVDDSEQ